MGYPALSQKELHAAHATSHCGKEQQQLEKQVVALKEENGR
jgi:hypothetical protein